MKLNNSSSRPLYEQLIHNIKDAIEKEVYLPGKKIPNEGELCEIYGVSRITVRRAIQELVEAGLLERKQGKGTFVCIRKLARELVTIDGFSNFSKQLGRKSSKKVLGCEEIKATKEIAKALQLKVDSSVLKLSRIMYFDNEPFSIDVAHYSLERFPNLLKRIFDYDSTYDVLKNVYHVDMQASSSKKILTAVPATEKEAEYLDCDMGDILFNIDKTVYDEKGIPIHISITKVPTTHIAFTIST
ncbi:GntR family frlABCD operon transcriptional regulator [Cytobacillus oceanisediminis]|uniref:GntR family frlABCD operon transcriptional regulator n=1 Tax=Cytobacillus oceanisediminis TaxID=665099 RepID=A0A2V2ZKJ8_9BACI|nr:UTRA domain-containing protein [Cytobacillus oceanisediminis]PWW20455.1 GntR family frlABCD operon transcriptional regulator [Cytobacillus oceanisediminis]